MTAALVRPTVEHSGGNIWTVSVPTETGTTAVLDITHDSHLDSYTLRFSGELLDLNAEGLTATIQMALLELRHTR
jgi:hypothetical protein